MAKVDANKEIRRAVDSGKVLFGLKQSEKSMLNGDSKLIIIAGNTPELEKEKLLVQAKVAGVPFYEFKDTGLELGSVCGKPFTVSVMSVVSVGKSKVLEIVEKKKQ